ncbi:PREDICTED: nuclear nucleic acid-binding protein C1D-like [Eufriesea mexicana]|uniref:nuclear nucleic acid-binding protein C1D-like n=1 Tax=Eufriesea mexicana TaxID=516756 RepID=UPI00083BD399|nr:PREDICTED: nuclear nucleic acid-binding protein C1D-like [Eufriesea mexicana]
MDTDFKELSQDTDIVTKVKQFHDTTLKIEDTIKYAVNSAIYEKLSNTDKIEYNLLMSYCLNSMFWMYLRTEGIDPAKHRIKLENDRLKKSMARAKQINDRNTLMPRVNKDAAQRFVRNSLWEIKNKDK